MPSVALAKLASAVFVATLSRKPKAKPMGYAIGAFCATWMLVGILAVSFQCSVPRTWGSFHGSCFDQVSSLLPYFRSYARLLMNTDIILGRYSGLRCPHGHTTGRSCTVHLVESPHVMGCEDARHIGICVQIAVSHQPPWKML